MTSGLLFFACLALALAAEQPPQTLVDSIVIERPHEFDFNKWAISKSLEESLVRLNQVLFNRLPKNKEPAANIQAAKEILRASRRTISEQVFRKALKSFIALEQTDGQCNWRSYVILAENYVASENHLRRAMARVYSVMDHYFRGHAQKCRPYYRQQFHELTKTINGEDLRRVELCFSKLSQLSDISIICGGDLEISEQIIGSLADRIVLMMRENFQWQELQPSDSGARNQSVLMSSSVEVANMIDEYLMRPCQSYCQHFRDVLVPVRLDAAVEDDQQWDFLNDDEKFTTGLRNYIICNSLLRNGAKNLYLSSLVDVINKLRGVR